MCSRPVQSAVQLLRSLLDAVGGAQNLVRVRQQLASGLGQHHAGGGAIEKAYVEFLLERLDVPADGRLA